MVACRCLAAIGCFYWYARRQFYSKEVQFNGYLDTIVRNIERTSHYAVRNLDVAMAVFGQDGKLQWKNELFVEYAGFAGVKNVDANARKKFLTCRKTPLTL